MSSTVSLSNGLRLRVTAVLTQAPGQQTLKPELLAAKGDGVYRVFSDQNGVAVFAYELAFGQTSEGKRLRVTARPVGLMDGGKPTPTLSAEREFPPLESGGRVSIELFDVPPNGKVLDTLEMSRGGAAAAGASSIRFAGLTVKANGTTSSAKGDAAVSGRYAMFYLPGHGAYFFTTDASIGAPFVKAGWIDGPRMQFTIDNESFECISRLPIVASSRRAEVWVYHDPRYSPQGNWTRSDPGQPGRAADEFFAAASDSLNWFSTADRKEGTP